MNDPSLSSFSTPSRRSQWLGLIWRIAFIGIWAQAVVNFTIRDRVPLIAMFYYAFPTVMLGISAVAIACVGSRLHRSRAANLSLLVLAAVAFSCWLVQDFRIRQPQPRVPGSIRVVFWNVGRGWFSDGEKIVNTLDHFDADVLAITEATLEEFHSTDYWRERFPGYSAIIPEEGLVLLVKGHATLLDVDNLVNCGTYYRAELAVRGTRFKLIAGDIISDPWIPRGPPLSALWRVMQNSGDQPALVVGDFNTPPSSFFFDRWRSKWSRAWDIVGSGYQATWPQPLPVLPLDHVWGNQRVQFHHYASDWSTCSDHRPVLVDFTVIFPGGNGSD